MPQKFDNAFIADKMPERKRPKAPSLPGAGMKPATIERKEFVQRRRQQVAALRLRGLSLREITNAVAQMGFRHPDTGRPFSQQTIYKDLIVLHKEWRDEALDDLERMKGRVLAELREVRRQAWKGKLKEVKVVGQDGDELKTEEVREPELEVILKSLRQEADLLGLDDPKLISLTDPTGTEAYHAHVAKKIMELAEHVGSGAPVIGDEYIEAEVAAHVEYRPDGEMPIGEDEAIEIDEDVEADVFGD